MFILSAIWKRRRLWRRLFYWTVVPVLVLYLGSCIVLNTWVKRKVRQSLEARTGVEWTIGTLNWTPDGNVHVHALFAELGDGSLRVERILFEPKWSLLSKKRIGFTRIEVVNPSVDVSHAWLLAQARNMPDPSEAQPVVAQNNVAQKGVKESSGEVAQVDSSADPIDSVDSSVVQNEQKPSAETTAAQPAVMGMRPVDDALPKMQSAVDEFDAWLSISNANCTVRKANGAALFSAKGMNAEIPYGGVDLEGFIACETLKLGELSLLENASCNLHKKGPILSLKETEVHVLGVDMTPKFQLIRGRDGLYFAADLLAPKQDVSLAVRYRDLTIVGVAEQLEFRMFGTGRVDKPLTWQGRAGIQSAANHLEEGHRGTVTSFDALQAQASLYRGILQVPRAEMVGDDVSLLGNGVVTMRGYGFGVARIITSPEKRNWVDKLFLGSQFFKSKRRRSVMRPLNTVDTYYMDIELDGAVFDPMVRVDQISDWEPLRPALKRMAQFVREERMEEAGGAEATKNQR